MAGLARYFVFFVMRLKTRTLEIAGITCQPNEAWMTQTARKLTDAQDGFLRSVRYLILDRDPLYTTAFRRMLQESGVRPLLLPPGVQTSTPMRKGSSCPPSPSAWSESSSRRGTPPDCHSRVRGPLP